MDMDDFGWIKLYRKLLNNKLWLSEKFTRGQAWVDLLMLANHKDSMFFLRGNEIQVKRGQIARAEVELAKRWKWSKNKVRRFLEWLKTKQQIEQQQNNVINILEIINYEKYQQNETPDGTTERLQTELQKDSRRNTYNNVKNVKNEKNEKKKEIESWFESYWKIYPNRVGKKEALRHFMASIANQEDLLMMDKALENYKKHLKENDWKKPQNGSTWFNNWEDWIDYKEPITTPESVFIPGEYVPPIADIPPERRLGKAKYSRDK